VEERLGVRLATQQKEAVSAAFEHKLVVITGGPGTGKTTIIRAICEIAQGQEMRVALAAPTGRAARRMSQATERDAVTVHRLLEYNPNEGGFQHNSERPLDVDILILDESSMVDVYLLYAIVDALLPRAVLVLVGDIDQLPSVGPGTVLADIIESGAARVVRLTEIFRQAENSNIVANAYRINRGEMPQDAPRIEGKLSDFYTVNARSATHAQELILELVSQRIPSAFGLDPFEDIQVLAPMHRGEIGCETLNVALQQALVVERGERGVERGGVKWLVGDKVMQTRNNYERGVVNGDVGRIKSVEAAQKKLNVVFEDREVTYAFNELDELTHAFAITVHKSQGSEYPVVVMPVMTQHFVMLKRNLLYTAVTRARQLVVLVGTSRAVSIAVSQADTGVRFSGLAHRLRS
jgi:exodeoxyribonuclease V alpha subunit